MDVRFYHLTTTSLEAALPRLLEKVVARGRKILVHVPEDAESGEGGTTVQTLDQALWTYDDASFLAHDRAGCAHSDQQPILLTTGHDNENSADVLVLIDGADSPLRESVPMTLMMFDGKRPEVVETCRTHWKTLKDTDASLTYWQQTENGGWAQKA